VGMGGMTDKSLMDSLKTQDYLGESSLTAVITHVLAAVATSFIAASLCSHTLVLAAAVTHFMADVVTCSSCSVSISLARLCDGASCA
jgi:hypothetical protein